MSKESLPVAGQSSPDEQRPPLKRTSSWRKFWTTCLAAFGIWLVVFTPVWSYVTDLLIHWTYEVATLNDENPPDFRQYLDKNPKVRALCTASNWIAERTRPLVRDDVMISLWTERHQKWEDLIRSSPTTDARTFKDVPDQSKSLGLSAIYGSQNGSAETAMNLLLSDSVGRINSARACNGKGSISKYFEYYPNKSLVIYDGRVMPQSTLNFYVDQRGKQTWVDVATLNVIRRWALRDQMSIREISRRTGLARNTVKKHLRSEESEPSYQRRATPSKLDPYAEKLATWLVIEATKSRKQRRTLRQIHTSSAKTQPKKEKTKNLSTS